MALNLDKIRQKVAQLNGDRNSSDLTPSKLLYTLGEHRIRLILWPDLPEGEIFKERQVYFKIGKSWITSPKSFGDPDPIDEFSRTLWKSGTPEDRALAKKLFPQHKFCALMVDRAAEELGPQLIIFDKKQAGDILGFILDPDYGDVFDPHAGFDIKIKVIEGAKIFNGKKVKETTLTCAPKPSILTSDKDKLAKWMEDATKINVDEYYKRKTYGEIRTQFQDWLDSGAQNGTPASDSDGTERGKSESASEVDKLAEEVNAVAETEKAAEKKEDKKPRAKKASVNDELDAAFGELEEEA